MTVHGYSLFYRVDETSSAVDVFAVFYGTPSDARIRRVFRGGTGNGQ